MQRHPKPLKPQLGGVIQPVRIGFVPLVDCAPLIVAREMGLFHKHGVRVELSSEVGWATIREKLLHAQVDAAHAPAGLVLAMRLGLSSSPAKMLAPFVLNLHGNAITLSRDLWNRGVRDAVTFGKLVRSMQQRRFTLGVVSRHSSHYFLLRNWLAGGGIDPDTDLSIVVLPPTQMAGHIRAGLIDGCCVGEPWNTAAVVGSNAWIVATSEQLAPGHPEKVLAVSEGFMSIHRDEMAAIFNALAEACRFCDADKNRPDVAGMLLDSGCFDCGAEVLLRSLVGPFEMGTGERREAGGFHIFQRRDANRPTPERGAWLLGQFRAHGLLNGITPARSALALAECWSPGPPASPALTSSRKSKSQKTTPTLVLA